MKKTIHTIALFSSLSTLLCCALPALLVSLGAGAALAGLITNVPQLIWSSEHKFGLFVFASAMLMISGIMLYTSRNAPCPIDMEQAKACNRLRRISSILFFSSLIIYAIGFFFAFIARYFI